MKACELDLYGKHPYDAYMSVQRKVYRFRMKPTEAQAHAMHRMAGARRWVWNWARARKREHYKATGKPLTYHALASELTALKAKPETAWLKEADSQALQQTLKDLDRAFVNFFEKRARFSRFKSKKRDKARFRIPQRVKIAGGKVYCPKVGWVRVRQSREVAEATRSATFRREANGKWYVSLVVEFEMPDVPLPLPDPAKVVGIDLGLKDFAVVSDGDRTPAPRFYRKAQRRLKRAQRHASRCVKGSGRHAKAKARVARIHRQIADRRKDFLHQLTADLTAKHGGLCIEDLSLKGLARTKRLSKSFHDAALGEFRRQATYKAEWNRKHLVVIDRFFLSSRLCRGCGAINEALTLSDRQWTRECGLVHDRDLSAAINLRDEGLRILFETPGRVTPDRRNARGRGVRLATASSPG
jgi:putative transposase